MIVVHHLENSRSQRVLWLLEELGLAYELKHYKRDPKTMLAPPELKAIHPLGKSPVVTDDGVTLAESGAIIEALLDKYGEGRLRPAAGTPEYQRFRYWLHYAEGSAMPPLLLKLVFDRMERGPAPFFMKPILKGIASKVKSAFITPQIDTHTAFVNGELGKSTWFAGDDFSAADIQMSFPMEAVVSRGDVGERIPNIKKFVDTIHARPAYKKALERGGPFKLG